MPWITCPVCNGAKEYENDFGDMVPCAGCHKVGKVWRDEGDT